MSSSKLRSQNANYLKFYGANFSHFSNFFCKSYSNDFFRIIRIKSSGGWNTLHELCFIPNGIILLYPMIVPPIELVERTIHG